MTPMPLCASIAPATMHEADRDDHAPLDACWPDGLPQETLDRATGMVCRLLNAPVSMLCVADGSRQVIKSAHGLNEPWASQGETPLSHAISRHIVKLGVPLVFGGMGADSPLQGDPASEQREARAYLGLPLRNAQGQVVASLSAIALEKRTWSADDLATMRDLAALLERQMHLHGEIVSRQRAEARLQLDAARMRSIADAAPAMMRQTDRHGACIYSSRGWQDFIGQAPERVLGLGWLDAVHPEDRDQVHETILGATERRQSFNTEYRLRRVDGVWRRIADAGNPHFAEDGAFLGLVASAYDDTERRQAEETREFVGRELSHRIKNIFAMISAVVGLSARDHEGARLFAETLRDRIAALARAHEFALPNARSPGSAAHRPHTLTALLRTLLAPYQAEAQAVRIVIAVEDIAVGPNAAVTLAMLLHELTTNALKYGALAVDTGQIVLRGEGLGQDYLLIWEERGGPIVAGPPVKQGFGSLMVQRAANLQLGASFEYAWEPQGLTLTLKIPRASIAG